MMRELVCQKEVFLFNLFLYICLALNDFELLGSSYRSFRSKEQSFDSLVP